MLINQETKKELVLLEDLGMLYPTDKTKEKRRYGIYKCYCGNEFKARTQNVKSRNTKSCGCEKGYNTHGLTNHRLYGTWKLMIQRCTNNNHKNYNNYGAIGITVCDEWLNVANFIEDMYPTFEEGLTLDRKDTNGNYCKKNCRWATREVQNRNTRLIQSNNKSGYRGVCFNKIANKFVAQISVNSKQINLGYFNTPLEACKAYNKYVIDNNLEHTLNLI